MGSISVPHVQNIDDIVSGQFGRWGIYGQNGVGKTWLARSIPPDLPALIVSCDLENIKPLKGYPHLKGIQITHWNHLGAILSMLQRKLLLPNGDPDPDVLSGAKPFFRVIVFDTWTRIQALAVNKVVGYERLSPQDAVKFLDVAPKTPRGWEAWQQVGALTGEWMRYFEELPIHNLFLFQEGFREVDTSDGSKKPQVAPDLTPSALRHGKDTLEVIGRMYVTLGQPGTPDEAIVPAGSTVDLSTLLSTETKKVDEWMDPNAKEVRNLFIGQHPLFFAKGPTHKLGRIVVEPTFRDLLKTIDL